MNKWQQHEIDFLIKNHPKMTTKELAVALCRDYSVTKRMVKKYVLDNNENILPVGFVVIPSSPIHAVNDEGVVIRIRTRKQIKAHPNKKGYYQVCLQDKQTCRIHRLVAELFVPNPDEKPQVNHIDGNKANNMAFNLEWVTNEENQLHAIKTGLWDGISAKVSVSQTGEGNSSAKLSELDVLNIYEMLHNGIPVNVIAKKYCVNHTNICAIKSGRSWKYLYHRYLEGSTARA